MRASAIHRFLSFCTALWFVLVSVDPSWLHQCDMHAAPPVPAPAATTTSHAHAGHHAAPGERRSHDVPHACTCIGQCCAAATTPLPHHPESIAPQVALVAVPTHRVGGDTSPRDDRRAFALPRATAPPRDIS